jgi:hypothetical protein
MNWKGGLFRLWLIVSVLWAALGAWVLVQNAQRHGVTPEQIQSIILVIVGPPLAVLFFGAALLWALGGFKVRDR